MSEKGKHVCVLCDFKLDSKIELQNHFRRHANKEIDTKGRVVKSGSTLKEEVDASDKANSSDHIVCDVCDDVFDNVTSAIQHKFRKHPESGTKHYCPHCGMQFPLKINCDRHMEQHPNKEERPSNLHTCQDCSVMFYNKEALDYHSKSTHKRMVALFRPVPTPPPSRKIKTNNAGEPQSVYYCHLCGFEYIVKFNLQKHLERQHTEEERNMLPVELIKCTTCDALFFLKKAYENHNMYHKPNDLYVTSEEQRLQTITRVDQDFDIRRVQTVAEKYIPVNRPRKRSRHQQQEQTLLMTDADSTTTQHVAENNKKPDDGDLSPSSSPPQSSSDSESEVPLQKRLQLSSNQTEVK